MVNVCDRLRYEDVAAAIEERLPQLGEFEDLHAMDLIAAVGRRRDCSFHWQQHGLNGWKTSATRLIEPMMREYAQAHGLKYNKGRLTRPVIPAQAKVQSYAESVAYAKARHDLRSDTLYLRARITPEEYESLGWEARGLLDGLREEGFVTKAGKNFLLWPTARTAQRYSVRRPERDLGAYQRTVDPVNELYSQSFWAAVDITGESYFAASDVRRKFAPSQIQQMLDRGVLSEAGGTHPLAQIYKVNTEHPAAYASAVRRLQTEGFNNGFALHTYQDNVSKALDCLGNYYEPRDQPDRDACVAGVKRVIDDARLITAGPAHMPAYDFVAFPLWARALSGGYDYPRIAAAHDAAQEVNAVIGTTYGRGGGVREPIPNLLEDLSGRIQAMIAKGLQPDALRERVRGPHSLLEHEVARRNNIPASDDIIVPPASIPAAAAATAALLDPTNPLRGVAGVAGSSRRAAVKAVVLADPPRLNEMWQAFEALPHDSPDRPAALEVLRDVGTARTAAGDLLLI